MKKIIIGNWKLNLDHLQGIQLLQKINYSLDKDIEEKIDIVLSPSHTSLRSLQTVISTDNLKIKISSQDVSTYSDGAFTGEVSAIQLKKLDIDYSIIGHSERRLHFNETDNDVNIKLTRLLENEIIPILCFGESLEQRSEGSYLEFIKNQINEGLKGVEKDGKTPMDTRTFEQEEALLCVLRTLKAMYPEATIHSHRDYARKACPSFDATEEYKHL